MPLAGELGEDMSRLKETEPPNGGRERAREVIETVQKQVGELNQYFGKGISSANGVAVAELTAVPLEQEALSTSGSGAIREPPGGRGLRPTLTLRRRGPAQPSSVEVAPVSRAAWRFI